MNSFKIYAFHPVNKWQSTDLYINCVKQETAEKKASEKLNIPKHYILACNLKDIPAISSLIELV